MAQLRYLTLDHTGTVTPLDERAFAELPAQATGYDLFLWVDGTAALAYKRSEAGVLRSSSPKFPQRRPDDGDLRPASARALLALIRTGNWQTPSEAVQLGNPLAAKPTERNAYLTVTKGRQALDFEVGHERWRAFALRRKSATSAEMLLRFAPPAGLRWLVAWSETDVGPAEAPATHDGLPRWLASRRPQVEYVGGLEIILRDAIFHAGRDEAAVLLDLSDPFEHGPFRIERFAIVTSPPGAERSTLVLESLYPGARLAVPGEQVERWPTLRADLPRGLRKPWLCVAWRGLVALGPLSGSTATRPLLLVVSTADTRYERQFDVEFRRVD